MKRKIISKISLVLVLILSFSIISLRPSAEPYKNSKSSSDNKASNEKILEARFLNMLNNSYVYDSDFNTVESVVNNSIIALLGMRDSDNTSYIAESYVKDFVFNMYGVEIDDFSQINTNLPKQSGYVYILPRGYSEYSHEIESVNLNEDGSYTVTTKVKIDNHDNLPIVATAVTLFVKNINSQFGYNIISSNIQLQLPTQTLV